MSSKPAAAATQSPLSTSGFTTLLPPHSWSRLPPFHTARTADTLITALEQRGYDVVIRQEPQDKLLHVQVGPFATRKEADSMRQRLLSDGYNAIVK